MASLSFCEARAFLQYQEACQNLLPDAFNFVTFLKFAKSDILDKRLSASQNCLSALQKLQCDNEPEYDEFISVVESFLSDDVVIQATVLEQMKNVIEELKKNPTYFERSNKRLSLHIVRSLSSSSKVQNNAVDAITNLLEENLLTKDTITKVIVPSLFDYALKSRSGSEDAFEISLCRVNVVVILNKIANSVSRYSKRWVYEEFLPRFSSFFTDSNAAIRKLSIEVIGVFARLLGQNFTEKCLVPHLDRATRDINNHVRKLCCDVFADVALSCSMKYRTEVLTPQFLCLLGDSDKTVYEAAIRQIGPFIATFADPNKTGIELRNGRLMQIHSSSNDHNGLSKDDPFDVYVSNSFRTNRNNEKKLAKFSSTDNLTTLEYLVKIENKKMEENGVNVNDDFIDHDQYDCPNSDQSCESRKELYDIPPGFSFPDSSGCANAFDERYLKDENNFIDTTDLFDDFEFEKRKNEYLKDSILNLEEYDENEFSIVSPFSKTDRIERNNKYSDVMSDSVDTQCAESQVVPSSCENISNNILVNNDSSSSFTYWSFNNISLEDELNSYCMRSAKLKLSNLKVNIDYKNGLGRGKEIANEAILECKADTDFNSYSYDGNKVGDQYCSNKNNNAMEAFLSTNSNVDVRQCDQHEKRLTLDERNGAVIYSPKNFQCHNFSPLDGSRSLHSGNSASSYWQKRLDLLHRSVQSVVLNGSNALAVTAAMLPSSLKRFSLDSINTSGSNGGHEISIRSPKSLIDRTLLRGRVSPKQKVVSSDRFLSAVSEDDNIGNLRKSPTSRFIVSPLRENCNVIEEKPMQKKNVSIIVPPLDLKLDSENASSWSFSDNDNATKFGSMVFNDPRIPDTTDKLFPSMRNINQEHGSEKNPVSTRVQTTHEKNRTIVDQRNRIQEEFLRYSIERSHKFLTEEEQEFLNNSKQDVIPQELLDRLNFEINMTNPEQFDVNRHVAHSIPAIVFTFGSSKWIFIKGLYLLLTDHYQAKVRECMAHSLHEVAAIIGTTNADRDLLPVFQKFLSDTAEVQYGLLKHLYDFCKILSLHCREQLAQRLSLFVTVDGTHSYRLRAEFAEQLVLLVRLFSPPQVNRYLSAFALTFATDRIAEVRNNGVRILAEVLALFIREEWADFFEKKLLQRDDDVDPLEENEIAQAISLPLTDSLLFEIRAGFWRTRNWRRRQRYRFYNLRQHYRIFQRLFGRMLDTILQKDLITEEQFFYIFYDDFMHISEDDVANVRQYFCSICQLTKANDFFKTDLSVSISVKSRLREMAEEDLDLEVRHQAQIALGELDPETTELDLGQRELILLEASESIYRRSRQARQKILMQQATSTTVEVNNPTYSMSCSAKNNSNSSSVLSLDSKFNGNCNNSNSFHQYQYYIDDQDQPSARKPPLAVAEDEDDNVNTNVKRVNELSCSSNSMENVNDLSIISSNPHFSSGNEQTINTIVNVDDSQEINNLLNDLLATTIAEIEASYGEV